MDTNQLNQATDFITKVFHYIGLTNCKVVVFENIANNTHHIGLDFPPLELRHKNQAETIAAFCADITDQVRLSRLSLDQKNIFDKEMDVLNTENKNLKAINEELEQFKIFYDKSFILKHGKEFEDKK